MDTSRILAPDAIEFLKEYVNNPSPTGFESGGQQMWLDYIKPYVDDYVTDAYGSAVAIINPEAEYKVVIEAHADEISWFVSYITDDGLIYLVRNGGSDHQIAPSKRVNVHTDKGIVKAVFGWPAIHTRGGSSKEKAPSPTNIFLDCGCNTKDEVLELGIHVGCVVTYEDEFMEMNDRYFARFFDEYHDVDREVRKIEEGAEASSDQRLETLKLRRLKLKDDLLAILETTSA